MSLRSLFLLVLGAVIVTFIAVNWAAMTAPAHLNLLFTEVDAPLGVVLLGLMAVLAVAFVSVLAYTQGAVLLETRRHTKEMAAQRELADKAEASRFTELRAHLDEETARLTAAFTENSNEMLARIDRLEMGLREGSEPVQVQAALGDLNGRLERLEGMASEAAAEALPAPQAEENAQG